MKFQNYLGDRCILLLNPLGELEHLWDHWWNRAFELALLPDAISEIWTGVHEWVTDRDQDWIFEKVYPILKPGDGIGLG